MTTVQFNLNDTINAVAQRPLFTPELQNALKSTFNFQNVEVYEEEEVQERGPLGHYVYVPWKFDKFNYKDTNSDGSRRIYLSELYIPLVMIEVQRAKNMEMTPVEGRDGTVKEYGSHGDHVITVKGILLGDGAYPKADRDVLKAFEDVKVAVPVSCPILNDLLIFDVVIQSLRWVPMEGVQHAQAFEMTCVEDNPVRLKLQGEV